MININNSKESTKSSTEIASLKNFAYYEIFYKMFFFSLQIYFKVILYTAKFKSLNTARAANEVR